MTEPVETRYQTLHELIRDARAALDANAWDYLTGGTETETTVMRNRLALDSVALRPRVLNDVSTVGTDAALFGQPIRLPVILAPVGGLDSFDPGAAMTVAQAAGRFGVPMMLSSVSRCPIENVRAATDAPALYQLYVRGDADWVDAQVQRVIAAGFDGFCFTVDSAVYSRRERDITKRFVKPWRSYVDADAVRYQAALDWTTIRRIKDRYDIPIILKGIATAEDAALAVEYGIDVVYVSNHGGRQLDYGRGTLDVLPEVMEAVGDAATVWIDGGFSRGTDIVKGVAMGAGAVGLGRLYCYAMAAAGGDGIVRMLELLEIEMASAVGLLGVTSLDALTPAHLHLGAPTMATPGVLSAFPLLDNV